MESRNTARTHRHLFDSSDVFAGKSLRADARLSEPSGFRRLPSNALEQQLAGPSHSSFNTWRSADTPMIRHHQGSASKSLAKEMEGECHEKMHPQPGLLGPPLSTRSVSVTICRDVSLMLCHSRLRTRRHGSESRLLCNRQNSIGSRRSQRRRRRSLAEPIGSCVAGDPPHVSALNKILTGAQQSRI